MAPPPLPRLDRWSPVVTAAAVFSVDECAAIAGLQTPAKAAEVRQGAALGPAGDWRRSEVAWIRPAAETAWVFQRCEEVLDRMNEEVWRCMLAGFTEPLQLARYAPGQHYDWHLDMGAGRFSIRKLSFIVQLTDPAEYQGGAVEFSFGRNVETAQRAQGGLIAFPSFVLHRVAPVETGERKSLVGWLGGPHWA